jgi:hypothetical protein
MISSNKIQNLFKEQKNQFNIIGLAYGYKVKNKIKTKEKSLIYFVQEKKDVSQLDSNNIIPSNISIDNITYTTDVIETPEIKTLGSNCGAFQDQSSDIHRNLTRPVKGGISIGPFQPLDGSVLPNGASAGTLGGLVIDKDDGAISFLTNNHVLIADAFINSEKNPNIIFNHNTKNRKVTQPGSLDNNLSANNIDFIGHIKRYYPISSQQTNLIDAALISTDPRFVNINESFKILGIENAYPLPFATTEEIDNLLDNDITLYKSGRSTGFNSGDDPPCRLSVFALNATLQINFPKQNNSVETISFSDCFIVTYDDLRAFPAGPGDSGSFVIGNFNGVLKIVGLLFAGDSVFYQWFAFNRIDKVAELLNIEAWKGDSWEFTDQKQWSYLIKEGLSSEITIVENDKKYWQIGVEASVVDDNTVLNNIYVNYDPSTIINSCKEYDPCSGRPLAYNSKLDCNI